jgi:natural product precursor
MVSHLTRMGWRVAPPIGPRALVYKRNKEDQMKTAKKPSVKKLVLSKETIRTLESQELSHIVGGDVINAPTGWYCTRDCGDGGAL